MNTITKFNRQGIPRLYQIQLAQTERRMIWAIQECQDRHSLEGLRELWELNHE